MWIFNVSFKVRLSLAQHEIWQPDITLYNSITHNMDYYGTVNVYVEPSGNVTWVPPATFKTFCDSSLRYWPFDSHKCTLLFGSWVYHGHEIDVVPKKTTGTTDAYLDMFIENPEWEVNDVKAGRSVNYFACCVEPYVDVHYNITIARRSSIYHTVILAPAFVVVLLVLFTFWLPAQYDEKILLNGVTALIIVLFLLYFSQKLKVMASHTPLIGKLKMINTFFFPEKLFSTFHKIFFVQFYSTAMHCTWCAFQR